MGVSRPTPASFFFASRRSCKDRHGAAVGLLWVSLTCNFVHKVATQDKRAHAKLHREGTPHECMTSETQVKPMIFVLRGSRSFIDAFGRSRSWAVPVVGVNSACVVSPCNLLNLWQETATLTEARCERRSHTTALEEGAKPSTRKKRSREKEKESAREREREREKTIVRIWCATVVPPAQIQNLLSSLLLSTFLHVSIVRCWHYGGWAASGSSGYSG